MQLFASGFDIQGEKENRKVMYRKEAVMNKRTISCDLNAFDEQELQQHEAHAETIDRAIKKIREFDEGYAFRVYPEPEIIRSIGAFISGEKQCCPFFNFRLDVPAGNDSAWFTITGSGEVKQYLYEQVVERGRFGRS